MKHKYYLITCYRFKRTMNPITIIGLIAAAFTTVCLFPQLMRVYKTKSAKDISTGMFMLYSGGVFLWFIYGLLINDLPLILANSIAFLQGITILLLKTKYK